MKSFMVALCVFAVAAALSDDHDAKNLRNDYNREPEGDFNYAYETSNGINAQASGVLTTDSKGEASLGISGFNTYTSPEGLVINLQYTADENGYKPQGDHLPTPPAPEPIPEYIQRSLEYIKAHPQVEKKL